MLTQGLGRREEIQTGNGKKERRREQKEKQRSRREGNGKLTMEGKDAENERSEKREGGLWRSKEQKNEGCSPARTCAAMLPGPMLIQGKPGAFLGSGFFSGTCLFP